MRKLNKKMLRFLLCIMPLCLFFSYHPVVRLGESETMYFELSVAEIWLVLFDAVGVVELCRRKKLLTGFRGKWWVWALLPVWLTLSVAWSLNTTRGALTAGLMWAVVIAIYLIVSLRDVWNGEFRRRWWKWFLGSTLAVCVWCVVQCVLDLAGVSKECTLLCDGCTYRMFGFPHPNGFAIEPQFMGNLLLAPALASAWLFVEKHSSKISERKPSRGVVLTTGQADSARYFSTGSSSVPVVKATTGSGFLCPEILLLCFSAIIVTLFLTFSRGAIYAFMGGLIVMTILCVVCPPKRLSRNGSEPLRAIGVVWLAVVGAFVVALVGQGVMAEVSPTKDTFSDGVAKVVNHLTLGVVDWRGGASEEKQALDTGITEEELAKEGNIAVEKPVENFGDASEKRREEDEKQEAVFDGYVAESTDTRLRLSGAALEVWSEDFKTMIVGVGLGGAGQALYNNGLSPAPREIVQNEYVSLLLETGLVGISLFVLVAGLVLKLVWKTPYAAMIIGLFTAYGISLFFFSGLPNALQIYLMPAVFIWFYGRN